ncbi:MAG: SUMF1/EgtB/PvdO family nonheme iron enzyme [Candidatus Cloacimonetes bacterium]|nr:SUMF1/EgtB/PvdO family nonheme iron enzyme [Candidatus Cloacimonadota bacterium]
MLNEVLKTVFNPDLSGKSRLPRLIRGLLSGKKLSIILFVIILLILGCDKQGILKFKALGSIEIKFVTNKTKTNWPDEFPAHIVIEGDDIDNIEKDLTIIYNPSDSIYRAVEVVEIPVEKQLDLTVTALINGDNWEGHCDIYLDPDQTIIVEIEMDLVPDIDDFEWCNVSTGEYTYGEGDTIKTIDYDYQIMKYEVTNVQYVTYLEQALTAGDIWIDGDFVVGYYEGDSQWSAGYYDYYELGTPSDDNYAKISWDGNSFIINVPSGYNPGDFDDHPVVYVSWFGAWSLAEHYGLRLPTEHEWEKAARGNTGWDYPWGDNIDASRANYRYSGDPFDNGTTPVGFYNGQIYQGFQTTDSPSPFGAYDMAGNVYDWTDSFWSDISSYRVVRGGSWYVSTSYLLSWYRYSYYPSDSSSFIGFRCVLSL